MIFELRVGSNFDDTDEAMLAGQNGEGAALTNIFSKKFVVETCDGKNKFKMVFENNSQTRNSPSVNPGSGKGTTITYHPDWERLGMKAIDDDNIAVLVNRIYQVAACNSHLKVFLNGSRINVKSFKDYISMFTEEYAYDENENWRIGIAAADEDGFTHTSFVCGGHTRVGGTHVDYVTNQICTELRSHIKKKHRIDIKPSELKQHFRLFIDCQIVNPRYGSQTKEELMTEVKDFKTTWTVNDKFITKIIKSSIIQSVLDWAAAKAHQEEMKELRKLNKASDKANLKHIKKFNDATEKDRSICSLFLAEGDCLEENTLIDFVDSLGQGHRSKIKDIRPGDLVLTHENRFKEVTEVAFSVKRGIEIWYEGRKLILSEMHRLLAYNTQTLEFNWVQAKDLDQKIHKFVRSTVHDSLHAQILDIRDLGNLEFEIELEILGVKECWQSTNTHKFYIFDDETLSYRLESCENLRPLIHNIAFRK